MRKDTRIAVTLAVGFVGMSFGGCAAVIPTIPVPVPPPAGATQFDVQADTPAQKSGAINFADIGIDIGRGSFEVDLDAITITRSNTGGSKGTVAQQGTTTLVLSGAIGSGSQVDTVCADGDMYGPFMVTLDENDVPISVSPSTIDLTQNTIDNLNSGMVSVCLEVELPFDGSVQISTFTLNLGV